MVSPDGKIKVDNTITSNNKDNEKKVDQVKNELNESYPSNDEVDNKINDLKDWVSDNFYPATGGEVD